MNQSRSPFLMSPGDTALWVIDVQTKLLPLVERPEMLVWNISRLLRGADVLGIHVGATEQYPEALGDTVRALAPYLPKPYPKLAFSCAAVAPLVTNLETQGINKVLLAGLETHICVQQTALDMLAQGYDVYLAADAMQSRVMLDHQLALDRISSAGGVITTTESVLFEWCEVAQGPRFERIRPLVREQPPTDSGTGNA